jgi:Tol biopolymer transport system component
MTWLPSVSREGRIALSRFQWTIHLFEVRIDSHPGGAAGDARRITEDAAPKFGFSLSADGRRLAYSMFSGSPGNRRAEIRVEDGKGKAVNAGVRLSAPTTNPFPTISPDGSMLGWRDRKEGIWRAYWAPVTDPVGHELCVRCTIIGFSSDNAEAFVDQGRRVSRVRISDGEETTVLEVGDDEGLLDVGLSRDDRWLAVQLGEAGGDVSLYAVPVRDRPAARSDWVRIDPGNAWVGSPRWSPDGSELYYLSTTDDFICVWGRPLDPATKVPVGDPRSIVHAHASAMKMLPVSRSVWSIEVGGDRLVFNAAAMTGDVYTATLDDE